MISGFLTLFSTASVGNIKDFSQTAFYVRIAFSLISLLLAFKLILLLAISPTPDRVKKYLSLLLSLLLLFFGGDLGFMFVARSFGTSYPLADQNWMRKYWNPINSYGYRANPIKVEDSKLKTNILVLGSSYTAGDGVEQIKDRYSNKLQEMLPEEYLVHNLGMCGSEAMDAYNRLMAYPVKPDMLIFAHTTKSIKGVSENNAETKTINFRIDNDLNPLSRYLVQNSYLLNYVFWKFYAPSKLSEKNLANFENNAIFYYLQSEKIAAHLNNLQKFINYTDVNNIPLIVLAFPAMNEGIAFSKVIVCDPIEKFFIHKNVPVIGVYELVKDIPYTERAVNSTDAHPGIIVHRLIAEKLYETFKENHFIN